MCFQNQLNKYFEAPSLLADEYEGIRGPIEVAAQCRVSGVEESQLERMP